MTPKVIFHPDVHNNNTLQNKFQSLIEQAQKGEIYLFLEGYDFLQKQKQTTFTIHGTTFQINNENTHIFGLENNSVTFFNSLICTLYQLVQVNFETLKDGKEHSKTVLNILYCTMVLSNTFQNKVSMYKQEEWYDDFNTLFQSIKHDSTFDLNDFGNMSTNMTASIKKNLTKGLPGKVPYKFIHDVTYKFMLEHFNTTDVHETLIEHTLLKREQIMYQNIMILIDKFKINKDLHIIVGASHLMPYLSDQMLNILERDSFFINYHNSIKQNHPNMRLIDLLKKHPLHLTINL